jgi:hypothetical protein
MKYGLVILVLFGYKFLLAQNEMGKLYEGTPDYFEGLIKYNIEVTGIKGVPSKESQEFLAKKPCLNMDMYFKDGDFIINMYNGEFPTTRLFIADSNRTYTIDVPNQRAFRFEQYEPESSTPPTALATGKKLVVAGVECEEYKVEKPNRTILYYVSDKYRVNTKLFKGKTRAYASFLTKGLNGRIPLKTIQKTNNLQITTTATKIQPQKLQKEQFRIPNGWKVSGLDLRR